MTRLGPLLAAALLVGLGLAQARSYHTATPTTSTADPLVIEQRWIADQRDCDTLKRELTQQWNVWKTGIRLGQDRRVERNLDLIKRILRRVQQLVREGRCDA